MGYKAEVCFMKGSFNCGEYETLWEAKNVGEKVATFLTQHVKNDSFRPIIICPSWRETDKDSRYAYKCSECNGESYSKTNYCPHCGVKMHDYDWEMFI